MDETAVREALAAEAAAARAAVEHLTDEAVASALTTAGGLLAERSAAVLAANVRDVEAAAGRRLGGKGLPNRRLVHLPRLLRPGVRAAAGDERRRAALVAWRRALRQASGVSSTR